MISVKLRKGDNGSMTAKRYLKGLRELNDSINKKIAEAERLRNVAVNTGGIDYSKGRAGGAHSADTPFTETVDRLIDLEREIDDEVGSYVDKQKIIIGQIRRLREREHTKFLLKRYVEFKSHAAIAFEMGYAFSDIPKLQEESLAEFQDTYKIFLEKL